MKVRISIAVALVVVSGLLFTEALLGTLPERVSDLLLNLGTELIGIVLTVAIIDHILERRRRREVASRIAREVLHDIDHHVWVWQGGGRDFDLSELIALLGQVDESDPVPGFTQNLLLDTGSRSSNTLRTKPDVLALEPKLKTALEELAHLSRMRDGDIHLPPKTIAKHLITAVPLLVEVAGLSMSPQTSLAPSEFRHTAVEQQEWRHFGRSRGA